MREDTGIEIFCWTAIKTPINMDWATAQVRWSFEVAYRLVAVSVRYIIARVIIAEFRLFFVFKLMCGTP